MFYAFHQSTGLTRMVSQASIRTSHDKQLHSQLTAILLHVVANEDKKSAVMKPVITASDTFAFDFRVVPKVYTYMQHPCNIQELFSY